MAAELRHTSDALSRTFGPVSPLEVLVIPTADAMAGIIDDASGWALVSARVEASLSQKSTGSVVTGQAVSKLHRGTNEQALSSVGVNRMHQLPDLLRHCDSGPIGCHNLGERTGVNPERYPVRLGRWRRPSAIRLLRGGPAC
jgi:hypothetical protein